MPKKPWNLGFIWLFGITAVTSLHGVMNALPLVLTHTTGRFASSLVLLLMCVAYRYHRRPLLAMLAIGLAACPSALILLASFGLSGTLDGLHEVDAKVLDALAKGLAAGGAIGLLALGVLALARGLKGAGQRHLEQLEGKHANEGEEAREDTHVDSSHPAARRARGNPRPWWGATPGSSVMNIVKIAAILGVTVFLTAGMLTYCSPYQTCVRGVTDRNPNAPAAVICARHLGGRR